MQERCAAGQVGQHDDANHDAPGERNETVRAGTARWRSCVMCLMPQHGTIPSFILDKHVGSGQTVWFERRDGQMPKQWSLGLARLLPHNEPALFGEGRTVRERKEDRRSRRSQRLIIDALLALMLEKRFERITVQEILDRADVGRSTFYAQFRNREEVLERALERVFSQLHDQQLGSGAAPGDQLLPSLELFRHAQETHARYPALMRGWAVDPHYQAVQRSLRDTILRQLALAGASHDLAVPPELAAEYLAGSFLTLVHWWLDHAFTYTPEQMELFFRQLVMPGVHTLLTDPQR